MVAGASRGCEDPTRTVAPVARAASAERMAPCRSSVSSYCIARTSRRQERISRHVSSEDSARRQPEKFATWTQSGSGLSCERGARRSDSREHKSSAQRSSISHPIFNSRLARRNAAIAGSAWMTSPIALKRTTRMRSGRTPPIARIEVCARPCGDAPGSFITIATSTSVILSGAPAAASPIVPFMARAGAESKDPIEEGTAEESFAYTYRGPSTRAAAHEYGPAAVLARPSLGMTNMAFGCSCAILLPERSPSAASFAPGFQPRKKIGGRVVLGVAYDFHPPAICPHLVAFGNILSRVIGAFGLHIRTNVANQRAHVRFGEDHDRIHVR